MGVVGSALQVVTLNVEIVVVGIAVVGTVDLGD